MEIERMLEDREIILSNLKKQEIKILEEFREYDKEVETNKIAEAGTYNIIRKSSQRFRLKSLAKIMKNIRIVEEAHILFMEIDRECREVLEMLYIDGRTWDWIAEEINKSKTTIGRRRNKGIRLLEEKIKLQEKRIDKEVKEEIEKIIEEINL